MSENIDLKMTFRPVPVPPAPDLSGTGVPKSIDDVAEALKKVLGPNSVVAVEKAHKGDPFVVVQGEQLFAALKFLRDDQRFLCQLLQVVSAVDYPPPAQVPGTTAGASTAAPAAQAPAPAGTAPTAAQAAPLPTAPGPEQLAALAGEGHIAVVYALWSYTHRHQIVVKVHLDRQQPRVASVCDLYRGANWYERECYDLLGVIFEGHPNHARILLPPDWVGFPLRKDYVFPEEYNGMKVPL